MSKIDVFVLMIFCIGVFLYPLAMRWSLLRVHPSRLKMLEIGKELLKSDDLKEIQKKIIRSMMGDALDWTQMYLIVFFLPIYLIQKKRLPSPDIVSTNKNISDKYGEFLQLYGKSIIAANPIVFCVFILEVFLLLLIWNGKITIGKLGKKAMAESVSQASFFVEERKLAHAKA